MSDKEAETVDNLEGLDDDLDDEPVMGLPAEVEICDRYFELVSDPMVRMAISGVVISEGKISASKTRQKLKAWFSEITYRPFETTQLKITTFLNSLWYVDPENLSSAFWWTHKAVILKLLYVCSVAEACNLQQYGVTAKVNHIPRAVLFIYDYIASLDDEYFADLEAEFKTLTENHDEFCQVFMKSFGEVSAERSSKTEVKVSKVKSSKSKK